MLFLNHLEYMHGKVTLWISPNNCQNHYKCYWHWVIEVGTHWSRRVFFSRLNVFGKQMPADDSSWDLWAGKHYGTTAWWLTKPKLKFDEQYHRKWIFYRCFPEGMSLRFPKKAIWRLQRTLGNHGHIPRLKRLLLHSNLYVHIKESKPVIGLKMLFK